MRLWILWLSPDHSAETRTQGSVFSTPGTSLELHDCGDSIAHRLTNSDTDALRASRLVKRGPRKTPPDSVVPPATMLGTSPLLPQKQSCPGQPRRVVARSSSCTSHGPSPDPDRFSRYSQPLQPRLGSLTAEAGWGLVSTGRAEPAGPSLSFPRSTLS